MSYWKWSTTAANNGTADASCPFPEGMSPSAVNDGARGMMAAAAKHRDDIAGLLITGGTSTAYTIFTNQGFDTLAHLHGAMICFTPHVTNGANGTSLNVDGLGVKPILPAPGVGLQGGVLVQGTPYAVMYNHTDGAFYLHGFFGNPYNVPLAAGMDYWAPTAPNTSFAFPIGQAISRTTYATLFALIGTTYGGGDGSTTFNLPDKTGRVSAMKEAVATRLTATHFGGNSANLGAVGGLETHTLNTTQIPAHTHANTLNDPGHVHGGGQANNQNASGGTNNQIQISWFGGAVNTSLATTGMTITNASAGGGAAHNNVQPTIICNYIIRIL
jgi:microcystin-dependent protein